MITGNVYVDLRKSSDDPYQECRADRRRLAVLERCPDGASVLVDIGRRQYISEDAARHLHEQDHRLAITIQGDLPEAVARFVRAARDAEWSVVA
ncbi:hypothetical protein SAMN04488570_1381 [Nocardioides scoriae]|uniref:STAS domain-containing protein n=1 Tax=Nocardioides scoriae TaxID=642780 RepID=A0A1H1QCX1_9ACTN|nr:hypothetical protein [Nocardioides scoriae]SDS21275.1 hypothetical protein SAMN04488570_1381 [Nocardioides scoriae]